MFSCILNHKSRFALSFILIYSLISSCDSHRHKKGRNEIHSIEDRYSIQERNQLKKDNNIKLIGFIEQEERNSKYTKLSGHGNRRKHTDYLNNIEYFEEDQFLKNSNTCPKNTILIDGDCVSFIDISIINLLAIIITITLLLVFSISIVLGTLLVFYRLGLRIRCIWKIRKSFGFFVKRKKDCSNSIRENTKNFQLNEKRSMLLFSKYYNRCLFISFQVKKYFFVII